MSTLVCLLASFGSAHSACTWRCGSGDSMAVLPPVLKSAHLPNPSGLELGPQHGILPPRFLGLLRIPVEEEQAGLDVSHHGGSAYNAEEGKVTKEV